MEVNPPPGQQPIHRRLLTTHQVVCLEQALQVIRWYTWRWRIEQLFTTLKTAGLNLEATELESITAIQRLSVLALSVAVRILQLIQGRDNPNLPATIAFSDEQQQYLSTIASLALRADRTNFGGKNSVSTKSLSSLFPTLGYLDYSSTWWLVCLQVSKTSWNYYFNSRTLSV